MWLRVAALIGRTVEEAQDSMTAEEFIDWCALYQLEPWGWHADNWRMGVVAATTANYSGHTKKPLRPADFLPDAKPVKRRQTPAEMRRVFDDMADKGKNDG